MSATLSTTTISGRILIPWVSSSKKRSKPALAAGIGELLSRLFSLRLNHLSPSDFGSYKVDVHN